MAEVKTVVRPYELLIRFDQQTGEFRGAAFYAMETTWIDGKITSQKETQAIPLDQAYNGPWAATIESVLRDFETQLTQENDRLTKAIDDKEKEHQEALAKKDDELNKLKIAYSQQLGELSEKLKTAEAKSYVATANGGEAA